MAMREELFRLREIYKTKLNTKLEDIMKQNDIKQIQKDLGLQDYMVTMSKPQHFEELVEMMVNRYGEANIFGPLLDKDERYKTASTRCHHFCQNGRLLLYINNETNKIDLTTSMADLCDYYEAETAAIEQTEQLQKMKEVFAYLYSNINPEAFSNINVANEIFRIMDGSNPLNIDELSRLYGTYLLAGFTMKRKNVNPFLFAFNAVIVGHLALRSGYKYGIGEVTHTSIEKAVVASGWMIVSEIKDIDNFRFKDNTIMKDVLNVNYKKRGFTPQQIETFKKTAVLKITAGAFTQYMINNTLKMIHYLKSMPSKAKL
eukprot:293821_1